MNLKDINLKDRTSQLVKHIDSLNNIPEKQANIILSFLSALPNKMKILVSFIAITFLSGIGLYIHWLIIYSTILFWISVSFAVIALVIYKKLKSDKKTK